MLSTNSFIELIVILFTYMFVYNISLLIIFWTLFQFININFKTLYSFSDLKLNFFFISTLTITFLSVAGVPPFIGFFPKLLILIALLNSNFFVFYVFFLVLLFLGLYFYIQNIRFLHSSSFTKINYSFDFFLRSSSFYYLASVFFLFFLTIGPFFADDIIFYFYWLFS